MAPRKPARESTQSPPPLESGTNSPEARRQKILSPGMRENSSNSSSAPRYSQSPPKADENDVLTEEYSLLQSDESDGDYTPSMDKAVEDQEQKLDDIKAKLAKGKKLSKSDRIRLGELTRLARQRDQKKAAAETKLLKQSQKRVAAANLAASTSSLTALHQASTSSAEQKSPTISYDRDTGNHSNPFSTLNAIERAHRGLQPLEREFSQALNGEVFANVDDDEDIYDVSDDYNRVGRSRRGADISSNDSEPRGHSDRSESGDGSPVLGSPYRTVSNSDHGQAVAGGSDDPDSSDIDDDNNREDGKSHRREHQDDNGGDAGDRASPNGERNQPPDSRGDQDENQDNAQVRVNLPIGNDFQNWSKEQLIKKLRESIATQKSYEREDQKRHLQQRKAFHKRRHAEIQMANEVMSKRMTKMKMVLGTHLDRRKDLIEPHEALNKRIQKLAETMDPATEVAQRSQQEKQDMDDNTILRDSREVQDLLKFTELAESVQQPKAEWSLIWRKGAARRIVQSVIWRLLEDEVFTKPFEIWGKQRAKLFGELFKEAPGEEDPTSLFGKKEVCSSLMAQLLDYNSAARTRHQEGRIQVVVKQLDTLLSGLLDPKLETARKKELKISAQVERIVREAITLGLVLAKGRASYEYARMTPGGEHLKEDLEEIKAGENLDDEDTADEQTDHEGSIMSSIPMEHSENDEEEIGDGEDSGKDSATEPQVQVMPQNVEDGVSHAESHDYRDMQGFSVFHQDGRRRFNAQWMDKVADNVTPYQGVDLIMSPALLKHGKIDFDDVKVLAHARVMAMETSRVQEGGSKSQLKEKGLGGGSQALGRPIAETESASKTQCKRQREDVNDGEEPHELGRGKRKRRAPKKYEDENF